MVFLMIKMFVQIYSEVLQRVVAQIQMAMELMMEEIDAQILRDLFPQMDAQKYLKRIKKY